MSPIDTKIRAEISEKERQLTWAKIQLEVLESELELSTKLHQYELSDALSRGGRCSTCGFSHTTSHHQTPLHWCVHSENGHNMKASCGAELDSWTNPPNWTDFRSLVTCGGCAALLVSHLEKTTPPYTK